METQVVYRLVHHRSAAALSRVYVLRQCGYVRAVLSEIQQFRGKIRFREIPQLRGVFQIVFGARQRDGQGDRQFGSVFRRERFRDPSACVRFGILHV